MSTQNKGTELIFGRDCRLRRVHTLSVTQQEWAMVKVILKGELDLEADARHVTGFLCLGGAGCRLLLCEQRWSKLQDRN